MLEYVLDDGGTTVSDMLAVVLDELTIARMTAYAKGDSHMHVHLGSIYDRVAFMQAALQEDDIKYCELCGMMLDDPVEVRASVHRECAFEHYNR